MKRKLPNITSKIWSCSAIVLILIVWQTVSTIGLVEHYMLPSPVQVGKAFVSEFPVLMEHSIVTLAEAFIGLAFGILLGFAMAVFMDQFDGLYRAFYPVIVLTQTIPTVAIAPLLVLWFGYEMTPKVILIVITTFFPIAVGLLNGFKAADQDSIHLLRSMGAGRWQIFRHIKFPGALWAR